MTPSAELKRGQQATVVYTDRIKRLVQRGYVVIKKGPWDTELPDATVSVNGVDQGPGQVGTRPDDAHPGEQIVPDVPQHPAESAQPLTHDVEASPPAPPALGPQWSVDAPTAVVDNPEDEHDSDG